MTNAFDLYVEGKLDISEQDMYTVLTSWDLYAPTCKDMVGFIRKVWYEYPRTLKLSTLVLEMCDRVQPSRESQALRNSVSVLHRSLLKDAQESTGYSDESVYEMMMSSF